MRPRAQRRLPQAIATGLARIVVVYAESVRVDLRATRELCQVTACAVGHDAEFQYQLRPAAGVPSALLLAHMQLEPADFAGAIELGAFRERWRRFAFEQHARPIIAAWNQSTLELLANAGVALPERLLLKSAYRGRCGTGNASLEDVITAERLSPSQNALRGRAAWRIACAVAVVRHLHGLQHSVETHA